MSLLSGSISSSKPICSGVCNSQEVIFVSDGASWCRQLREANFPGATYVPDFWHLAKNLKVCLGTESKGLVEVLLILAARGETGRILGRLGRLWTGSRDLTWRAKLQELINCIDKNADGIKNASKIDFYGSGPIEKAVDITACRRFKRRGMSW